MEITVKAPAKINLFLDIVGILDSGYHSLSMVMQTVSLFDEITVSDDCEGIELTCSDLTLPTDSKNIAYKAAQTFFDNTGIKPSAKIHIVKRIPKQAGLAGGSTDGAGVLRALNKLYGSPLSIWELARLGLKAGSDVPFCVIGGTALAQNTGGVLSPMKPLKDCFILLAKPDCDVSTPKAFAMADETKLCHPDFIKMIDALENGDLDLICKLSANVFEQVIEVPDRVEIKAIMRKYGCKLTQMSGSGPTVFGIFEKESGALKAKEEILSICSNVYLTKPCDLEEM